MPADEGKKRISFEEFTKKYLVDTPFRLSKWQKQEYKRLSKLYESGQRMVLK